MKILEKSTDIHREVKELMSTENTREHTSTNIHKGVMFLP
jgi:hypothetical protein